VLLVFFLFQACGVSCTVSLCFEVFVSFLNFVKLYVCVRVWYKGWSSCECGSGCEVMCSQKLKITLIHTQTHSLDYFSSLSSLLYGHFYARSFLLFREKKFIIKNICDCAVGSIKNKTWNGKSKVEIDCVILLSR